ncbi:MAG TPA: methyltransferase domain-containing protein [Gaiellales bacterium]|jgi:SAM-dependent methyltransferase|nr:methyltransferase domain-containing protein [Gaiellales bacterium]
MSDPRYDVLGTTYTTTRREDPELAVQIHAALGAGRTLLNVGAGAGAYEPRDRAVLAVEPSPVMIAQRAADAAPAVLASAERLPFVDSSFDAAMALHTVHHWNDPAAGLAELRRVARRVVVVAGDAAVIDRLWLTSDYFPGMAFERRTDVQPQAIAERLGGRTEIRPLRVPADCLDGFTEAFMARPESYLDPGVRRNISTFRLLPDDQVAAGLARLRRDLVSGAWDARHGELRRRSHLDAGLRIIISEAV